MRPIPFRDGVRLCRNTNDTDLPLPLARPAGPSSRPEGAGRTSRADDGATARRYEVVEQAAASADGRSGQSWTALL